MGVLRRTWLADSVNGMKVDILCVYRQLILADIISDNVSAVLVFLVRYMHKLSISSLSSYLRHDISNLSLPKRSSIRDSKSHSLSIMLQSES